MWKGQVNKSWKGVKISNSHSKYLSYIDLKKNRWTTRRNIDIFR